MIRGFGLQRLGDIALSVALVTANAGCGALFNNSISTVPVSVSPAIKARIFVDGTLVGESPVNVRLTSADSHIVSVEGDGYERQTVRVDSHAGGGYIAADCVLLIFFLVPGIIALAVDGGSGDWKVLDPDEISFRLPASRASPPPLAALSAVRALRSNPIVTAGCPYDAQCRGDRVCQAGTCVERAHPPSESPNAPASLP